MATKKFTSNVRKSPAASLVQSANDYCPSMSTMLMMDTLWDAAKPNLTDKQLAELDSYEDIRNQLQNISDVMSGIGCLVADDEMAGNFQHKSDVPTLLFMFANLIDTQARAIFIAGEAGSMLQERKERAVEAAPTNGRKQQH
ncbi:MAG TPA: hypothetical protein VMV91_14790 [Rhodocyclaceae bacterium]|nr:hypothetical protein [Rhodocyclaceae bacterium]